MVGDWAWGESSGDIHDGDPHVQAQMRQRFPHGRKTATRSVDWMLDHYKTFAQVIVEGPPHHIGYASQQFAEMLDSSRRWAVQTGQKPFLLEHHLTVRNAVEPLGQLSFLLDIGLSACDQYCKSDICQQPQLPDACT